MATGGEDNTCRIWDLRKKKSLYIIPAHSNLISQVKFEPQEGYYLVTASYDMTAKVQHFLFIAIVLFKSFLQFMFLSFHVLCVFIRFGQAETLSLSRHCQDMKQKLLLWILVQVTFLMTE